MATTDVVLTVTNDYVTHNGAPTVSGTGGTWPASTYSFMIVAGYNGSDFSDIDALGWPLDAVAAWNGVVVVTATNQITFSWNAPDDLPDYYKILVQEAATYDLTAAGRVAATVAGTAISTTIAAYPGASPTITLAAAYSTVTLVPVLLTPQARDSVVTGHDGSLARRSYAVNLLYGRIGLTFFASTCTAAEYKTLQRWSRLQAKLKLDDMDTSTYVDYWIGLLARPSSLNSEGKNTGYPAMEFVAESEVYN